jgi:hypothetical protein
MAKDYGHILFMGSVYLQGYILQTGYEKSCDRNERAKTRNENWRRQRKLKKAYHELKTTQASSFSQKNGITG